MKITGTAVRLKIDDDINTDYVISGRYKFSIRDPNELARHIFEDLDPDFARGLKPASILVAGKNFGCGSSREQAPLALKYAGIKAVLAESFARIFYRNSFNLGLVVVECDTSAIETSDEIEIDLDKQTIFDRTKDRNIAMQAVPAVMLKLLEDGGIIEHFKKHGGFKLGL